MAFLEKQTNAQQHQDLTAADPHILKYCANAG